MSKINSYQKRYFRESTQKLLVSVYEMYKNLELDTEDGDNYFQAIANLISPANLYIEGYELMMQKSLIFLAEYMAQKDISRKKGVLKKLRQLYDDVENFDVYLKK